MSWDLARFFHCSNNVVKRQLTGLYYTKMWSILMPHDISHHCTIFSWPWAPLFIYRSNYGNWILCNNMPRKNGLSWSSMDPCSGQGQAGIARGLVSGFSGLPQAFLPMSFLKRPKGNIWCLLTPIDSSHRQVSDNENVWVYTPSLLWVSKGRYARAG